ncbi:hypothetical protein Cni_G08459 [Canna indica]|uniref:Uncharacterized protein n=1 Tax=Canna indica TaxID=4628 RepID=A0AAQ3K0S7_9LILI|nr:hypothetical protein Cni_G08459 [Canna indica]
MRDMVACFSDHAVRVAESSCSGSFASSLTSPPLTANKNTASSSYKATLSTRKQLLVNLIWHRTNTGDASVLVAVEDDEENSSAKRDGQCQVLRKKKGNRPFPAGNSACTLFWDFSAAKYAGAAPEPVKDFYLVVLADDELVLLVGDTCRDFIKSKFERKPRVAEFSMYRRAEQVFGVTHHSTKARFCRWR